MSKSTRRSFLEHTLYVAAAGLAAAQEMPSAKADDAAPPKKASSNERVSLAVIGLNGRGQTHLENFGGDESVDIVAICDVDQTQFAKSQQMLKNHGRPEAKTYTDLRQVFDDKSIQAVSVATPNHWHTLAGIWAMQAGKDAYVEKPVCHNISEGRRLEQARVKYGRVCQAGTQSRSNTAIQAAIQYIHDGKLGDVLLSRGLCYKRRQSIGHFEDSDAPSTLNYDTWLGPAPKSPFNKNRFLYNWHWNWNYGNGDIGNQGPHQLDVARWAINKPLPASGLSVGGRFGYVDDGQTANSQVAFFDFGGPQLLFEVRGFETKPYMGVTIGNIVYGTEGMIVFGFDKGAVLMDKDGKVVQKFKGSDTNHFFNFINAVRAQKQELCHAPVLECHYSCALAHIANTSYRLGTPDSFDAVAESLANNKAMTETFGRFEDHLKANSLALKDLHCTSGPSLAFDAQAENYGSNAAANAYLTREYRDPFVVPATL